MVFAFCCEMVLRRPFCCRLPTKPTKHQHPPMRRAGLFRLLGQLDSWIKFMKDISAHNVFSTAEAKADKGAHVQ